MTDEVIYKIQFSHRVGYFTFYARNADDLIEKLNNENAEHPEMTFQIQLTTFDKLRHWTQEELRQKWNLK
jgi:hypothetical protein